MATLTRWEPLGLEFPTWVTRLFEDRPMFEGGLEKSTLRIEEFVEDDTLVVRAELPGVDVEKDVDVSVHDGLLFIKAERTDRTEKKDKSFFRSEFRYGAFARTVPLPPDATVDDVKATYQDGVLEVRIPTRTLTSGASKVPVQRG